MLQALGDARGAQQRRLAQALVGELLAGPRLRVDRECASPRHTPRRVRRSAPQDAQVRRAAVATRGRAGASVASADSSTLMRPQPPRVASPRERRLGEPSTVRTCAKKARLWRAHLPDSREGSKERLPRELFTPPRTCASASSREAGALPRPRPCVAKRACRSESARTRCRRTRAPRAAAAAERTSDRGSPRASEVWANGLGLEFGAPSYLSGHERASPGRGGRGGVARGTRTAADVRFTSLPASRVAARGREPTR